MLSMLTVALVVLIFLQCNILRVVGGACEKEADLNFESCDLKHLNDDVLTVSTYSILILINLYFIAPEVLETNYFSECMILSSRREF